MRSSTSTSLDEMQLACDPSDPALQFRTSTAQVNDWLQSAARAHASNLVKCQQLQKQKQLKKSNAATSTNVVGNSSSSSSASSSSAATLSAVACSIRRFRHFATAVAGSTTVASASSSSGAPSNSAISPMSSSPSSPSAMRMMLTMLAGGGGGGSDGTSGVTVSDLFFGDAQHHQQLRQLPQQNRPASPHQQQREAAASPASPSTNSKDTSKLSATQQLFASSASSPPQDVGGTTSNNNNNNTLRNNNIAIVEQNFNHDKVLDTGTAFQICRQAALPSSTPIADAEITRLVGLLNTVCDRTRSMPTKFAAPHHQQHQTKSDNEDWLVSRLHRQVLRSVKAHPLSKGLFVMPAGERLMSFTNNTDATANTTMRIFKKVSLRDPIHGHRIRFPVRSECCPNHSDNVTVFDDDVDGGDQQQQHGTMCLYSIFLLAVQYQQQLLKASSSSSSSLLQRQTALPLMAPRTATGSNQSSFSSSSASAPTSAANDSFVMSSLLSSFQSLNNKTVASPAASVVLTRHSSAAETNPRQLHLHASPISFDASASELNLHDPFMTCPLCHAPISLSSLFVDQTMTKILKEVEAYDTRKCSNEGEDFVSGEHNKTKYRNDIHRDFVKVDLSEFPRSIEVFRVFEEEKAVDRRRQRQK